MARPPIPLNDPIARIPKPGKSDKYAGYLTDPWMDWWSDAENQAGAMPVRLNRVSLNAQNASIAATDFSGTALTAGVYLVYWFAAIVQAATTSSSLTVTVDFTDETVSKSFSGAAITGNTTATFQSQTLFIRVDNASPVRYSTAYASAGATPMLYDLELCISVVAA